MISWWDRVVVSHITFFFLIMKLNIKIKMKLNTKISIKKILTEFKKSREGK
jgi:hypothetical protein